MSEFRVPGSNISIVFFDESNRYSNPQYIVMTVLVHKVYAWNVYSFSHKSSIYSYTGTRWRHRRAVHPPFQERSSPFCDVSLVRLFGDEGGCVQGQDVRDHQGGVSVEKKSRHFFFFSERTEPFTFFFCCNNLTLDINAVSHSHTNDN